MTGDFLTLGLLARASRWKAHSRMRRRRRWYLVSKLRARRGFHWAHLLPTATNSDACPSISRWRTWTKHRKKIYQSNLSLMGFIAGIINPARHSSDYQFSFHCLLIPSRRVFRFRFLDAFLFPAIRFVRISDPRR